MQCIYNDQSVEAVSLPTNCKSYIDALQKGDFLLLLETLLINNIDNIQHRILEFALETVRKEVKILCSKDINSPFKLKDIEVEIQNIYSKQDIELKNKAPFLRDIVFSVAVNPRADSRNKMKSSDSLVPGIMNAINSLLFCHNQQMNANTTINTLVLRRGKADKMCYNRFQALKICLSHHSALEKQFDLGKGFQEPVKSLAKALNDCAQTMTNKIKSVAENPDQSIDIELSEERYKPGGELFALSADESFLQAGALNPNVEVIQIDPETESLSSKSLSIERLDESFVDIDFETLNRETLDVVTPDWKPLVEILDELKNSENSLQSLLFDPKFQFVGDNVDIRTKARHYLISQGNIDRHLFNIIVATNRIKIPEELIGKKRIHFDNVEDIPIQWFVPTESDEAFLKNEIKVLVARDLYKYIKELKWIKPFLINHITHEYSHLTSQKSDVVRF